MPTPIQRFLLLAEDRGVKEIGKEISTQVKTINKTTLGDCKNVLHIVSVFFFIYIVFKCIS